MQDLGEVSGEEGEEGGREGVIYIERERESE